MIGTCPLAQHGINTRDLVTITILARTHLPT